MKRDMELVRKMLNDFSEGKGRIELTSNEDEEYVYHLEIMKQANLISYSYVAVMGGGIILHDTPKLTWTGNDFLETFTNETIWNKVKDNVKDKGIEMSGMPLDILMEFGKGTLRSYLGMD